MTIPIDQLHEYLIEHKLVIVGKMTWPEYERYPVVSVSQARNWRCYRSQIMPIDKSLYPTNWPEIAQREKDRAGWVCEQCGADCFTPRDRRTVLTVHHIDHDPQNNDPSNLIALCSVCHLKMDAQWHARNRKINHAAKRRGPMHPLPMVM